MLKITPQGVLRDVTVFRTDEGSDAGGIGVICLTGLFDGLLIDREPDAFFHFLSHNPVPDAEGQPNDFSCLE